MQHFREHPAELDEPYEVFPAAGASKFKKLPAGLKFRVKTPDKVYLYDK